MRIFIWLFQVHKTITVYCGRSLNKSHKNNSYSNINCFHKIYIVMTKNIENNVYANKRIMMISVWLLKIPWIMRISVITWLPSFDCFKYRFEQVTQKTINIQTWIVFIKSALLWLKLLKTVYTQIRGVAMTSVRLLKTPWIMGMSVITWSHSVDCSKYTRQ